MDRFDRSIGPFGLWRWVRNQTCEAGHFGLFSSKGGHGWIVYTFNRVAPGWAKHEVLNFKIFALHRYSLGKGNVEPGWYITWCGIRKAHCGHCVWQWADAYRVKRR